MPGELYFDDVTEGDVVLDRSLTVDTRQTFFFSAATYNGHRQHHDLRWALEVEGLPDILVHGPLQAALMVKLITDWIGLRGRLVRFAIQHRGSAFPGEELRFVGRVVAKRDAAGIGYVDLELREEKGDSVILMPGTATVALPVRAHRPPSG